MVLLLLTVIGYHLNSNFRAVIFLVLSTGPEEWLALLVEVLFNKFCPSATVPAFQSIWFYNTWSDVWYEQFLIKRSDNNKPSSSIIRCVVSCIQTLYAQDPHLMIAKNNFWANSDQGESWYCCKDHEKGQKWKQRARVSDVRIFGISTSDLLL